MAGKILLIDDNEQDLKIMKRYLSPLGFDEILMAETGEQGLELAKTEQPDIVITDTQMPGVDGFEVCQKIKEAGLESKVIIITGHIDAVDAVKAIKMGAADYCVKTDDYDFLLQAVKGQMSA
ncbi:MAG: response regulator [Candidatus Omnitrophota bacterium]